MNRNYELTDETQQHHGATLYRIRATHDFVNQGRTIKAGAPGGWVEGYHNLQDNAWVDDEAIVFRNALAKDNAWVKDKAMVLGDAILGGECVVSNNASVSGSAEVSGQANIADNAWVCGQAKVYGHASVIHYAVVLGKACVYDNATISGHAYVAGGSHVYGDASILDEVSIRGNAHIFGDVKVYNACIYNDAWLSSDFDYLSLTTFYDVSNNITLYKTKNDEHQIVMDYWQGTIDDLEKFFIQAHESPDSAQEEMMTLCSMFRARIKRWDS